MGNILKFIFIDNKSAGGDSKSSSYSFVASKEIVDRDSDIIRVAGIGLKNYKKNPVVMSIHSWGKMPIGKVTKTKVEGNELIVDLELAGTQEGVDAKQLIDEEILNAVSIGFDVPTPTKSIYINKDLINYYPDMLSFDDLKTEHPEYYDSIKGIIKGARRVFYDIELLEVSLVPIPANQDALLISASKGIKKAYVKSFNGELMEVDLPELKAAIPFSIHTTMELNSTSKWNGNTAVISLRKWASSDGSGDKGKINWKKYRAGFTWFDSAGVDKFGSYKLPHHDVVEDKFEVVWSGVHTAMGSLLGSRGGVEIPEADRKAVYNHLAKHYKQFDKKAPEFKFYTVSEAIENLDDDTAKSVINSKTIAELNEEVMIKGIYRLADVVDKAEAEITKLKEEMIKLQDKVTVLSSPLENKSNVDKGDSKDKSVSGGYPLDRDTLKSFIKKIAISELKV